MKINLGCGRNIMKGYVNVDKVKLEGVDVVHNLDKFPYPFKDNSVDEVYARYILEHLDDTIKVMEELHRICKPGARIFLFLPYFATCGAFIDPQHKRFFGFNSFDYFQKGYRDYDGLYSKVNFKIHKRKIIYSDIWQLKWLNFFLTPLINLWPLFYQRFLCFIIQADKLNIELEVKK